MSNLRLVRSATLISVLTILSRILGFFRDAVIANFLGISFLADSFFVAFRIPNLFRRLLGEGALSNIFITVFSEYREKQGEEFAWKIASNTFKILVIILFVVTLAGIIFAEPLVKLMTFSFGDTSPKVLLTIKLTRIMFPYLFFIGLAAFLMGILNSFKHYFLPALSPVMLNLSLLGGVLIYSLIYTSSNPYKLVYVLAISVLIGGFLQFFIQFPKIFYYGFTFFKGIDFSNSGVKTIFIRLIPTIFALAVTQINIFVDTMLAWSLGSGAVSALYYSNRIMQFPLGVFGIAIATATIPEISDFIAKGENDKFKNTLEHSLKIMFTIILPSTVGFCVLSNPIIAVIFQRGKFDATATAATASSFIMYSLGLIAYSGVKILTPAFYALKDTKLPTYIGMYSMIVNIFLNIILMKYLSYRGLALATAISGYINFLLLIFYLKKKKFGLNTNRLFKSFFIILILSGIMGISVYLLNGLNFGLNLFVKLCLVITVGVIIYGIELKIFKIVEIKELIGRRKNA